MKKTPVAETEYVDFKQSRDIYMEDLSRETAKKLKEKIDALILEHATGVPISTAGGGMLTSKTKKDTVLKLIKMMLPQSTRYEWSVAIEHDIRSFSTVLSIGLRDRSLRRGKQLRLHSQTIVSDELMLEDYRYVETVLQGIVQDFVHKIVEHQKENSDDVYSQTEREAIEIARSGYVVRAGTPADPAAYPKDDDSTAVRGPVDRSWETGRVGYGIAHTYRNLPSWVSDPESAAVPVVTWSDRSYEHSERWTRLRSPTTVAEPMVSEGKVPQ